MRREWEMTCAFCGNIKLTKTKKKDNNYCGTSCFNKHTKKKDITGYKKCKNCDKLFPYRKSLKVRGYKNIKSNKSLFCSFGCSNFWNNKYNNPSKKPHVKEKIREYALKRGTKHLHTTSVRNKRRASILKEKHWNWQGGKTSEQKKIRNSFEYKEWRNSVFRRDKYTCVLCSARSSKGNSVILNADHIKPFCDFPELRLCLDNGRTLCLNCHKSTPTYGGKKKKISR